MKHFSDLGLSPAILKALQHEGYEIPTPIQEQAIPPVLEGKDLLGCAQTGTGKTAAFALPIIHRLTMGAHATGHSSHGTNGTHASHEKPHRGPKAPRALILSPTRELTSQIAQSFATYGRGSHLVHTTIFGGVSQFHQVKAIQKGLDILVATPGRLIDLMEQRLVDLSKINVLVLDEADRMLDMGFIQPIRRITAALTRERQTLLFSATMPKSILHLAESLMKNPVRVAVTPVSSTVELVEQSVYMVPRTQKQALLEHLLKDPAISRVVVFTRTKHGADKVARRLEQSGITSTAIHGNKAQNARERALSAFKVGKCRVLVATDVAARGLDVDAITHVINFDLPNEPEAYVHRIGRTGRAGNTGIAISFCDGEERAYLRSIEKIIGRKVPAITTLPALAHTPRAADDSHTYQGSGGGGGGSYGQRSGGGGNRSNSYASHSYGGGGGGGGYGGQRRNDRGSAPAHRDSRPSHSAGPTGHAGGERPAHAPGHSHTGHNGNQSGNHAPRQGSGAGGGGPRAGRTMKWNAPRKGGNR